jgi:hypothetical protein
MGIKSTQNIYSRVGKPAQNLSKLSTESIIHFPYCLRHLAPKWVFSFVEIKKCESIFQAFWFVPTLRKFSGRKPVSSKKLHSLIMLLHSLNISTVTVQCKYFGKLINFHSKSNFHFLVSCSQIPCRAFPGIRTHDPLVKSPMS